MCIRDRPWFAGLALGALIGAVAASLVAGLIFYASDRTHPRQPLGA